jgi:peptide deformylase
MTGIREWQIAAVMSVTNAVGEARPARWQIAGKEKPAGLKRERLLSKLLRKHEIDQLNGLFWIKRLSRLKRERLIKRFEKMSRS